MREHPNDPTRGTWRNPIIRRRYRTADSDQIALANEISHRIENEPLPASSGAGVDGHLLMRWQEWAQSIWDRYGTLLLKREQSIAEWSRQSGYGIPEPTPVSLLNSLPHRHALFADLPAAQSFPYPRNHVSIPMSKSGRLDVDVVDYNRYTYRLHNKRPTTRLHPTTLAVSPFPKSSALIVTPRTTEQTVPIWEAIAGPLMERGIRRFDNNFMVYARHPEWARETLTDDIVDWLLDINDVRVMADRSNLMCLYLPGWCPAEDLDELADLSATISRAARVAYSKVATGRDAG